MFYLILAIMLVLFYVFVAPKHIKGTINLVSAVFILVALLTLLFLGFFKVLELPSEFWVALALLLLGFWAMRDIHFLDKKQPDKKRKKATSHRRYKSLR